jgi:hypothetical protein
LNKDFCLFLKIKNDRAKRLHHSMFRDGPLEVFHPSRPESSGFQVCRRYKENDAIVIARYAGQHLMASQKVHLLRYTAFFVTAE